MSGLERTFKAFANKRRLAILRYLMVNSEAPVGELAAAIKLSFRSTSKHLAVLTAADIVEYEQRSKQIFYKPVSSPSPAIRKLLTLI